MTMTNRLALAQMKWILAFGFATAAAVVFKIDTAPAADSGSDQAAAEHVVRDIEGWTVYVDPALVEKENAGGDSPRALQMLANHLQRIKILVPSPALEKLQTVQIWLDVQHPRLKAMQYHPSREWLINHGHNPQLAKKVHICQADQLLSREQMLKHPAVILHELAHAYHDQVLGFDEKRIREAYQQAVEAGTYENVLLYNGNTVRHYGITDHKEYFAEGTEAFFYRNDFFPFVRAELKRHDPDLHAVLKQVWSTDQR